MNHLLSHCQTAHNIFICFTLMNLWQLVSDASTNEGILVFLELGFHVYFFFFFLVVHLEMEEQQLLLPQRGCSIAFLTSGACHHFSFLVAVLILIISLMSFNIYIGLLVWGLAFPTAFIAFWHLLSITCVCVQRERDGEEWSAPHSM